MRKTAAVGALVMGVTLGGFVPTADAAAKVPVFANCTAMHKKFPHGVGVPGARDHVTGSTKPVTNYYRSTAIYRANKRLDRDRDSIACEKR